MQATTSRLENLAFDSDRFPEPYCRQLCVKAVKTLLEGRVSNLQDGELGPNLIYSVSQFDTRNMPKEKFIKAFQCPTEPPIYLEVNKEPDFQTYSVVVFVKRSNLIDVSKDFEYFVKVVDDIAEGKIFDWCWSTERGLSLPEA